MGKKKGRKPQASESSTSSQDAGPSGDQRLSQPQQQQGGQQQQAGPSQQQKGPQQQQGGPPQHQRGQQQQGGPTQQQRGPQQQQQRGPPQQQRGQQQQQRGPPQQQRGQQQQQGGPPQQQRGPQQQQQGGPPQQQRGPQQQQGDPPQQQRGPQQQQQGGPPQQQRGPQQQQQGGLPQQQRGPQQQQQRDPQQQYQQQQRSSQQHGDAPQKSQQQQRSPQQYQQMRLPQQQQQQQLTQQMEQTRVQSPQDEPLILSQKVALVKPGTRGRKIMVESNHFRLDIRNFPKSAVHYDVALDPDKPKALLRDVMVLFQRKHYPKRFPAFDGRKNLYTPTKLPFGDTITDKITVPGENREKEFQVTIKFARYVDLTPLHDLLSTESTPQEAIQCLDIVLRNAPSNSCIIGGRSFFTQPSGIIELGEGMEMYHGFYQSAIRGWKPLLNVDVAHKAFPKQLNLIDLACEVTSDYYNKVTRDQLSREGLRGRSAETLEKFIRTLKVIYEIPGQSGTKRVYRVNGLDQSPSEAMFKLDDGKTLTVDVYFRTLKRYQIQFPRLPSVWVGARQSEKKILLPMELCTLQAGQVVNRKMTENQTSNMIRYAATSTDERKKKIMTATRQANYNSDPCVREFGLAVGNEFEKLQARVLEPPALTYFGDATVKPQRGVWRSDNVKFIKGACINKWAIACADRRMPNNLDTLASMVMQFASKAGMNIANRPVMPHQQMGQRQSFNEIEQYFKQHRDFDLIFVVVPASGPQYSFVKKAAEINVGCLTQCIKSRTLNKLNPQTVVNILLKVNSKLDGFNHSLAPINRPPIMNRPCMIMGADVTHPSPDAKDIPSVAAVTASHDPKAFKYNICWRLQPPKVEIIEDLCAITKEHLLMFNEATRCKPERIVFFRDGVSEGQFAQVRQAEILAIRKACKQLENGYEPKLTFLVVQKRHHTRLFPTNPRDSEDRNNNVPAGTCVDTDITNPVMQDFYLVSHASIQGVAKPTKYCTLWDDNDMSNDDIEHLAYYLCHMFTRCNRSVSYPAPTYYAHLAAARAKVYIENDRVQLDRLPEIQNKFSIQDCIRKDRPMFFV